MSSRTMVNRIREGDGDPRHGTTNGYGNHGCRCDACREAARAKWLEWSHRTAYRIPRGDWEEIVHADAEARDNHGSESRYRFGCRCDACKAASAHARAQRRLTPNVAVHGKNGYDSGCRCDVCRESRNVYMRLRRRELRAAGTGDQQ